MGKSPPATETSIKSIQIGGQDVGVQQMEGPFREGRCRRGGGARGFDFERHPSLLAKYRYFRQSHIFHTGRGQVCPPIRSALQDRLLGEVDAAQPASTTTGPSTVWSLK